MGSSVGKTGSSLVWWHKLGLGYQGGVGQDEIAQAAVLRYDGVMKPWLEIGIANLGGTRVTGPNVSTMTILT
jgi:hypothetical protein